MPLPEEVSEAIKSLLARRTFGGPLAHENAAALERAIERAILISRYEAYQEAGLHHQCALCMHAMSMLRKKAESLRAQADALREENG